MDIETRARKLVEKSHGDPMDIAKAMVKVARQHAALTIVLKQIVAKHPELRLEIDAIIEQVQRAYDEQES